MDLFEDDDDDTAPEGNVPEFSVSDLSGAIKRTIEGEFGHVRVRGEVGRVSRPASGHLYLDLKDDRAVLASVVWKGQAAKLAHRPEEGMEVIATGRLTTFPGQSRYQLVIEDIRPAGAGALMAMLEKRRQALAAEGLFDEARKRRVPYLPRVIGVVTSPSGAVIRDILHRLSDRFPSRVLVWPVAVQGAKCAAEVAAAIRGFDALAPGGAIPRPDLVIVARGGGSLEDLWGFNEEVVVRAAADCTIPLISAVGHETDTTLIDHAADYRAPTPTAAAERAVPVRLDLIAATDGFDQRLRRALASAVTQRGQRLRDLARALPQPEQLLQSPRQRLDWLSARLPDALRAATARKQIDLADLTLRPGAIRQRLTTARQRLSNAADRLAPALARQAALRRDILDRQAARLVPALDRQRRDAGRTLTALSPRLAPTLVTDRIARARDRVAALDRQRQTLGHRETLARGFAIVRGDGALVTTATAARAATALDIEFADGHVTTGAPPRKRKRPKEPPEQGTLL